MLQKDEEDRKIHCRYDFIAAYIKKSIFSTNSNKMPFCPFYIFATYVYFLELVLSDTLKERGKVPIPLNQETETSHL